MWPMSAAPGDRPAKRRGWDSNPFEKPAKTILFSEGGAESGALATVDPALATLIDAWPELPEAIRTGILAMVKAAARSEG